MAKLFCTGLSGYIGSNLKLFLEEAKYDYFDYDLKFGYDILDISQLREKMKSCDYVIHLGAMVNIVQCERNPDQAIDVNILGTRNVVDVADEFCIPIVFSSTLAAKDPRNIYGMTKRVGEHLVLSRGGVVLRLANVYGGINYLEFKQSAISNFLKAKHWEDQAIIYGDGSAERDFVYIDDVCIAFIKALDAPSGIYEVCTGKQITILELAQTIGVDYKFESARVGEVKKVPSNLKDSLPGWRARFSLKEGLKRLEDGQEIY